MLIDLCPATVEDVVAWANDVHALQVPPDSTSSTSSTRSTYPEIAVNGALALLAVATAMLDRQLSTQAEAFKRHGGFTERLYHERKKHRGS
jgi:four helix bundle suffix protein